MSQLVFLPSQFRPYRIEGYVGGGTVWLTQKKIAHLFATTKQNVSLHIKNIFDGGELSAEATVKDSLTVDLCVNFGGEFCSANDF